MKRIYGVEVKRLDEQVKRNIERFPQEFSFQLTVEENHSLRSQPLTLEGEMNLKSQIVTSIKLGWQRKSSLCLH
jgi:hypothetical protein